MGFLPTSLGLRPRLAVELRPEGVVAARSDDAQALVSAVSSALWPVGTLLPGLKPGNVGRHDEAVAGVRKALETVALKERQTTLILPDAAVRVLLLEFDSLPAKAAEALPIVRFRLKKLLPFDAEDAAISFQVMSQSRDSVRVLAVAVPKAVLAEYESVVRDAGFEPGAVLPSTLAACAGLQEDVGATLLVNAGESGVTTAIVQAGVLLLHRSVDLAADALDQRVAEAKMSVDLPLAVPAVLLANPADSPMLPLVDPSQSAGEWARQSPVSGYGVVDERDLESTTESRAETQARLRARGMAEQSAQEAVEEDTLRRNHGAPDSPHGKPSATSREVTQAISVAAAYFEDTLGKAPGVVVAAGTISVDSLRTMARNAGFDSGELRVVETVDGAMLSGGASTTRIERGWLAGVRGALRS